MTMPALAMPSTALPNPLPVEARQPRNQEDLLAPSIWSDRARLLARPDVVAVELILVAAAAVLLRQPLTEVLGTAPEAPPTVPAAPAEPVSPLALVPVAPPSAARHEPRDPFAPVVAKAQAGDGAPPADPTIGTGIASTTPTAGATAGTTEAAPADTAAPVVAEPAATTPSTSTGTTITIRPGDTLGGIARQHGIAWTVLYEANREVVGHNPNLVRPGTVLTVP